MPAPSQHGEGSLIGTEAGASCGGGGLAQTAPHRPPPCLRAAVGRAGEGGERRRAPQPPGAFPTPAAASQAAAFTHVSSAPARKQPSGVRAREVMGPRPPSKRSTTWGGEGSKHEGQAGANHKTPSTQRAAWHTQTPATCLPLQTCRECSQRRLTRPLVPAASSRRPSGVGRRHARRSCVSAGWGGWVVVVVVLG